MQTSELVGKPLDEVKALLEGTRFRVVSVDGKTRMVTMDYDVNRYNLVVVDSVVASVHMGW